MKDIIKGGYGDGKPDSMFDKTQLEKGIKVEMEHTNDKRIAREVAKDHLSEYSEYYNELEKMEFKTSNKRVIEFYNDGSFKYVDKRFLLKDKKGGYFLLRDRVLHTFDGNKEYIGSKKV
jgi:antitoxin component of MazEF toxin-antitoxin module